MKINQFDKNSSITENNVFTHAKTLEDADQIPEPGNMIRTKKMSMEGKVERVEQGQHDYDEVYFRLADGRLMKTPLENVIVIEKLVDEDDNIMEDRLDELSTELLAKYKAASGKSASTSDKAGDFKTGNKRFSGIVKATKKQFVNDKKKDVEEGGQGGINRCAPSNDVSYQDILNDVVDKWKGSTATVKETGPYTSRLDSFVEAVDNNDFTSILKKQYDADQAALPQPKAKIVDIPYHGWTIRYRPNSGSATSWLVLDRKGDIKHKGESANDKEAVAAAEDWIKSGGGTAHQATTKVTIDFNVAFAKQFAPDNEHFYAAFDADGDTPVFILSTEPQQGFKTSHVSPKKTTPVVSLSPNDCNNAKLQPNGRYILGDKDQIDDHTMMFPLIFQSITQSSNDKLRMNQPGLTVGVSR